MRLARHLGMTRRQLLDSLDEDELAEQIAFSELEPLPDWWQMWATLFESQVQQPKKKFDHERWLPTEKETKPMTPDEIKSAFMAVSRKKKIQKL